MSGPTLEDALGRPKKPTKVGLTIGWILAAVVILGAGVLADAAWDRLPLLFTDGWNLLGLLASGVLQNPFGATSELWLFSISAMLESLAMAWIGTVIGATISFPLGFLAARNVAPAPVVFVVRQVLNIIRAIPEIILAIALFLPIFGLGPLAGALALGIGCVGSLGKLSSEVIEGIDPGPIEALRASGANSLQVVQWSVLAQALPDIVAIWLYRFEVNIRASAVLGVLGAGGIGAILSRAFKGQEWEWIGIIIVVIIVLTIAVDQVSAAVRHRIIGGVHRPDQRVGAYL